MNGETKPAILELAMRIKSANRSNFGNQLKFFLDYINHNSKCKISIRHIIEKNKFSDEQLKEFEYQFHDRKNLTFPNPEFEASLMYQLLEYIIQKVGYESITEVVSIQGKDFAETHSNIQSRFIAPIVNFLTDDLAVETNILYILQRYKARTEWFFKEKLFTTYDQANSNYEKILEDDLRLYLFDQGIDYPFSTPHSASGRADIVSNLNTSEPLIVEIKIFDQQKNYGLNRIKDGLIQILKYANDYNKQTAFLIVFNMDNVELDYANNTIESACFPLAIYSGKLIYIVTINLFDKTTASKSKTMKTIKVDQNTLLN